MKKTFTLTTEGKNPERILEAVKHEIRKYIKRENRKKLPENMDYWRFHCEFGTSKESAKEIQFPEIFKKIDTAVAAGATSFYLVLISSAVKRQGREED